MADEIRITATHRQVTHLVHGAVSSLTGRGADSAYSRGIRLRLGMVLLACIQESFLAKASGGTGEDGIQWAPLKPSTIAARPIGQGDVAGLKSMGITRGKHGYGARSQGANDLDARGRLKRGFLTAAQDKRWRMIFATRKFQMMAQHGMDPGAASARAGAIAWATLKSEGAKTRLQVLGGRTVAIGRNSGRLFNSLSPGAADPDSFPILSMPGAVEDRILREEPGSFTVGSNVDYAGAFHARRPLWPDGELPAAWSQRIAEALTSGIEEMIGAEAGSVAA